MYKRSSMEVEKQQNRTVSEVGVSQKLLYYMIYIIICRLINAVILCTSHIYSNGREFE